MNPTNRFPKARVEDILFQEAGDELLVFDKKSHQAHCLNKLAGLVWRHCDGQRSFDDLARIVRQQSEVPADSQRSPWPCKNWHARNCSKQAVSQSRGNGSIPGGRLAARVGIGAAAALLLTPLVTSIATALPAAGIGSPQPSTTAAPTTTGT